MEAVAVSYDSHTNDINDQQQHVSLFTWRQLLLLMTATLTTKNTTTSHRLLTSSLLGVSCQPTEQNRNLELVLGTVD